MATLMDTGIMEVYGNSGGIGRSFVSSYGTGRYHAYDDNTKSSTGNDKLKLRDDAGGYGKSLASDGAPYSSGCVESAGKARRSYVSAQQRPTTTNRKYPRVIDVNAPVTYHTAGSTGRRTGYTSSGSRSSAHDRKVHDGWRYGKMTFPYGTAKYGYQYGLRLPSYIFASSKKRCLSIISLNNYETRV